MDKNNGSQSRRNRSQSGERASNNNNELLAAIERELQALQLSSSSPIEQSSTCEVIEQPPPSPAEGSTSTPNKPLRHRPPPTTEYSVEKVKRILADYFPEETLTAAEAKDSEPGNNTSWNPESVLGEEMSPIYDPTHGIVPEAAPPLPQKRHHLPLPVRERYYLAQPVGTLLKIVGQVNTTNDTLMAWNALKVKLELPKDHPSGLPESVDPTFIPLLDTILHLSYTDRDFQRNSYRFEMVLNTIHSYGDISKDLYSSKFDVSYYVERHLQEMTPELRHSPDEFIQRQFRALLELQEWADRIGMDVYGECYYKMIGVSQKNGKKQDPPSEDDDDDEYEEETSSDSDQSEPDSSESEPEAESAST